MIRALGRLLPYVARVKRPFAAGIASILAATALSLVSPWVLKIVIDGLTHHIDRTRLGLYALAVLGLALADGWFRYVTRRQLIGASRQIEYELRNDFFAHLERLPQAYFQTHRAGDLMSRATNDLSAVRMMIGPAVMYFLSTAIGFVIAVAIMGWIDVRLTLWALLPLPGVTLGTRYFGKAIHDRFERIQAQLADMSAVTQEALAGVRVVRAYRQERAELSRFRRANDAYVERNRGLISLQSAFYPTLTFCLGLSGLVTLWLGGRDVITGRLTLGEFVAFSRYLVLLSWPLIAFGWVTNLAQRGLASWERMLEVLDAPTEGDAAPALSAPAMAVARDAVRNADRTAASAVASVSAPVTAHAHVPALVGRIEARHLTFTYPGDAAPVLEDVSFHVEPGRVLAIVGATGAGKSTLVNLLPRLFDPPRGMLFVDGRDVRDWPLAPLRAAIGLVAQEPFLFSDTVGSNILFGLDVDWGTAEMRAFARRAAEAASLDADVQRFADGYDTRVGERGITLSGGQKQRVAIARALATDPRILILDDALSAVDTATEDAILGALREIRRTRTCLIVAHRVSAVRDADEILVLDRGRVVERGTHQALVAASGLYADLHRRQFLEDVVGQAYDARLMRRLVTYLRPHRIAVAVAFVAILAGAAADLAQPIITEQAIDKDIAIGNLAGLWRLSIVFLGLLGLAFAAEFVQTYVLQITGQRIMHAMRMQVYAHLQALDLRFYDRNPVGRMMTRVTTDVDALNDMFTSGVITVFGDGLALAGVMIAMAWMSWRLALVAFLVLPLIVWTAHWFRKNARESYRRVRGLVAQLNAFLQEHLTGMATVQLFGQQPRAFRRFDAINAGHRDANLASIFFYAVFYPLVEISAALSTALIIWVGGGWAMHGAISIGVLVAFLQYSRRFFQPISDLSEKFNVMQAAMAASERIFTLLDTPVAIRTPASPVQPAGPRRGRIEFDRVSFAYAGDEFVLRDVSFVVEPGERIGIVGATGAGKTTVINLLLRFYDVTRGRILVDGVDVREWDLDELRATFGLVLQDVHLFAGTIEDNIRLGNAALTDAGVRRAADVVHARRFIEARPLGFKAPVAERGAMLSVGEKQLLSFARAVALEPRVLLLDEATSSIDTATEALIEDALRAMMAGRTVLAIAHRISTIQDMDRILVFHNGRLVEAGGHDELVARGGVYFRLYQLQYRESGAAVLP